MLNALRYHMTWQAVPIAAIVAGTVFLLINAIGMPLAYQVDLPLLLRYMASLVLGPEAVVTPGGMVLVVGLFVHFVLSCLAALVIAVVVHHWGMAVGIVGGATLGLAIYGINLYALTVFFDWFFAVNNPVFLFSHLLFGALAGGVYELFDHYDAPLTTPQEVT